MKKSNRIGQPWSNSKKIGIIMKLTAFLLIVSIFSVQANVYSQKTKVTLNLENVEMHEVFEELESLTDFKFLYNHNKIDATKLVSVKVTAIPLSEVLSIMFRGSKIDYILKRNQIILKLKADISVPIEEEENSSLHEDNLVQQEISGVITDNQGVPIPGVSVVEKNTSNGAASDFDGNYSIMLSDPNSVLVFSFIGFVKQEVLVGQSNTINVTMEEDVQSLDEVVVVGYGTVRRSDLTGSISSVSAAEVKTMPAARIDEALQGRTSGLVIQNNSAAPDGGFTLRIRGSNSLTGSNDPLIVIDGFIGGNLSTINPNDIKSIEVLKDASSTAIYGSRGANGVILVTTKGGNKNGKTVVQYNSYTNFQSISNKIDLLNAAEYAETVNANRDVLGLAQPFTSEQISNFKANGGTDWQDEVFRNAIQQNHQISISGGGDMGSYYLSANLTDNEGIIKGSSFKRYSVRSNIESNISGKLKAGLNIFFSKTENHASVTGGTQDLSPVQGALIWSPTQPVFDTDGSYTRPSSSFGPPAVNNPYAMAVEPIRDNLGTRVELNGFLNYNIIDGLSAKILLGTRFVDNENNTYLNTKPNGGLGLEEATIFNSRTAVYQITNQINYNKTIAEVHDLNVTAVYEQQRETFNSSQAGSLGFLSDFLTYNNLGLGSSPQVPESNITEKSIQSFVGRINYSFDSKYLVSINGRYDGASVFTNEKWGFFPSAALGWRVSSEKFMEQFSKVSNLKLRTSYGVTGSQAIAPYSSLSQLNSGLPYPINGSSLSPGIGLGIFGNPDLKWEKTTQFNIGMDLGLFDRRVNITLDYYNKNTSDLLMNVPLPRTSGYESVLKNVGEVQNKGFEIDLSGSPLVGDFKWKTGINFSRNINKVIKLSESDEIVAGATGFPNMGNTIFLIVGQPIGVLKGYIQDGTWGTSEAAEATSYETIPGAPKYIDQNNDGQINSDDIAIMGNTQPKFTYGWNNTFNYKDFDLNILVQGNYGNKVYNLTRIRSERTSSDADATDVRILNRWTPDNQDTDVPSFEGSNQYEKVQSSRWLEDGSYLRLKNVTLGYDLSKIIPSDKISFARIYIGGINLFTATKYTGYDPEASTNVGILGGIDIAPYPAQKTYTIGLNVTF